MRHLQIAKYLQPRYAISTVLSPRFMSKAGNAKSSGSGSGDKDDAKCKEGKDAQPSDTAAKPAEAAKKPTEAVKKETAPKEAKESKTTQPKDETVISGGTKCQPKINPAAEISKSKKKPRTCEEILLGKGNQKKRKPALTAIQGGDLGCPGRIEKRPPIVAKHAKRWQKISLFGVLPLIAVLSLLVFSTRMEGDRLEFKNYTHMYKRSKPFWFRDGNRTAFHNSHLNALPPAGYEDEVDESAIGQDPESEPDKKARLKEFDKVVKNWRKHSAKRDAQLKKEAAAAEKEARRQEAQ
ncbi:uncharacterized protein LOC108035880 isoform X2 [Drosophila biarmipes]|uniref:uncharacterized protein LOC108035880 isoform X2 n=1 Tax=Drosophila biarmipes TaxID=125945 RepID=UPI0007E70164|nr:uncharacterized protein LOC108035880 isoform X2 [Drosophila biarmipes]